jgi:hypothetical protein
MTTVFKKLAYSALLTCTVLGSQAYAAEVFRDDFNDTNLEQRWDIRNKSSDSLAVENGEMLLLSSKYLLDEKGELENILTPKLSSLAGDWSMEIRFSGEFQTAREELAFGITNGEFLGKDDVWASVGTRGDQYYGWAIYGAAGRQKEGRAFLFSRDLLGLGCNVCGEGRMFPDFAKTIPQPITAKFEKRGQQYVLSVRLGVEGQPWTTLERVTAINATGKPFIVLRQTGDMKGETLIRLDSVVVEANG